MKTEKAVIKIVNDFVKALRNEIEEKKVDALCKVTSPKDNIYVSMEDVEKILLESAWRSISSLQTEYCKENKHCTDNEDRFLHPSTLFDILNGCSGNSYTFGLFDRNGKRIDYIPSMDTKLRNATMRRDPNKPKTEVFVYLDVDAD